jgi:hypothetical protein
VVALPPADWYPAAPDFVGIGVKKAGTTWWYRLIDGHPRVYSRHWQKERNFFAPFGARPFGEADVAAYAELFYRPRGGLAGEWTPRYICDFWVPELLKQAAPNVKLLVLLRDPVPRYVSGVRHSINVGGIPLRLALRDEYYRGRYTEQLTTYLEHFDRSQLLVQVYEQCIADPVGELRRTFEFLGIEPGYAGVDPGVRYNASVGKQYVAPEHVIAQLTEMYRPEVSALGAMFPDLDLGHWSHFG